MQRNLIADLHHAICSNVRVLGWVHTLRDQKRVQFIIIRDHTGFVQA